jgi:ketosteroid isomerase-like protein
MSEIYAGNDEDVKQELLKFAEGWSTAIAANDADGIGSFMGDDWVIVSDRGISDKERFLGFVRSGALRHSAFEMLADGARIRVYGDSAVMTCRVVNTAHFGGQQFEADEWTSDVFIRQNGKWICVLSQITPVDKAFEREGI